MGRGPGWTKEEDAILREHYPREGSKFVARMLDRTPHSVRWRAHRLGIKHTRRFWTAQEIAILREVYPHGGVKAVHERLPHRTHQTILSVAHRKGVLRER